MTCLKNALYVEVISISSGDDIIAGCVDLLFATIALITMNTCLGMLIKG